MVVVFVVGFIAILICTCVLAWRNLKLNRGDRRGALRFSFYLFLLEFVARLLQAHFVPDIGEFLGICWMIAARALFFGAVVWVAYIAIEPHIRRLWPHTMISWTRLLAGHLKDPKIGRDILVGGAVGITFPLLEELAYLVTARLGNPVSPALAPVDSINAGLGPRYYFGALSTHLTGAASGGIYMFLIFLLFRIVFRKDWVAAPAFVVLSAINSAMSSSNPYMSAVIYLVLFTALLFVMRSHGLLAVMAVIVFINLPSVFPITTDLSRWYSNASLVTLLFLAALALFGFRTALGGRPAFAFDLLKE